MTALDESAPLVSVCVPSYKRSDRLRRAMERLLSGSYRNLEVIISDNASPDQTQHTCEELSRRDSRVRYFRQPHNIGATRNFLFARAQARGKYFLWHADDDYLSPDYIRQCVDALERDPSLVLAAGVAAYHTGDESIQRRGNIIPADTRSWLLRVLRYVFLVEDNSIFYGVYRRDAVAQCRLPRCFGGDAVWVAEVLMQGRAQIVPSVYVYRETSDNASASPAGVARALEAPRWHGQLPWIAMPLQLATQLAFHSERIQARWLPTRVALFMAIFTVSFAKQVLQILLRRVPYGQRIYARCFSSEMPI